ncbi:MAG TPA: helix-turn-helix domain-containing protein [Chloroflexia bacterium]|nr:helix-turn-helix domain-containing protein [Chloroflexia bacterium]
MPGPKPPLPTASPAVVQLLQNLARSRSKPAGIVRRSQLILAMLDGLNNAQLARNFDLHLDTARLWRNRWINLIQPKLAQLETDALENDTLTLANALETLLKDEPRPGTPATFTPEQIVAIVALACENPRDCGYPFEHWTPSDLAREAVKRQLVSSISPASVGRFLKRGGA